MVLRRRPGPALFTVVHTPLGEYVRAMRQCGQSWEMVTDHPVVHQDTTATARVIWQLIALLTY
ncbi:hypothetical protein [Rhodococcus spongiicola]|uniref:Transposase n=1 Tax=Rhodococcus spongiicola TaxID=2487352 RepID=A0A3S3ZN17_9NOCA|nr:hypothetical protein [Rhodococcus spongiicola]RVW04429.1 hypothetical protein EF834_04920 [Rhodococcus spongiicola]